MPTSKKSKPKAPETILEIIEFLENNHKPHNMLACMDSLHRDSLLIISPHLAGRVIAMSSEGLAGKNTYFVNPQAIANPDLEKPYHPEGGGRWWPAREIDFCIPPGTTDFSRANLNEVWKVPHYFDKTAFNVVDGHDIDWVLLRNFVRFVDVKKRVFDTQIDLEYKIATLPPGISTPKKLEREVSHVGYSRTIVFTNTGDNPWNKKNSYVSPWVLDMLNAGKNTWIVLPVSPGTIEQVLDYKMSGENRNEKVPSDRFLERDNYGLLKADAKEAGKKGIPPKISNGYIAAVDLKQGSLTLMNVAVGKTPDLKYRNNLWQEQGTFDGTAFDCYNDNGDIGNFLEIEAVSPVPSEVEPGRGIVFPVVVHHFKLKSPANIPLLYDILKQTTGVDLSKETYKP